MKIIYFIFLIMFGIVTSPYWFGLILRDLFAEGMVWLHDQCN